MTGSVPVLDVRSLAKRYEVDTSLFEANRAAVQAVTDVSFAIDTGVTFGLVGESGSGKTTTAKMILQLEQPTAGSIVFRGRDLATLDRAGRRAYKRAVQAVFQDPYTSLDPRMRVRDIIAEPLQIHERLDGRTLDRTVENLLERVGLNPNKARWYPHEFSGGQRQRIALARAISVRPELIVLDEPVSALDVSIRAQILNTLSDLQEELGVSYLLISHDLAIVEHMSHRIGVMYAGQLVELAPRDRFFAQPRHPYAQALKAAVPQADPDVPPIRSIGGEVPDPSRLPVGCRFRPRCPLYERLGKPAVCVDQLPTLGDPITSDDHLVACHFADRSTEMLPV